MKIKRLLNYPTYKDWQKLVRRYKAARKWIINKAKELIAYMHDNKEQLLADGKRIGIRSLVLLFAILALYKILHKFDVYKYLMVGIVLYVAIIQIVWAKFGGKIIRKIIQANQDTVVDVVVKSIMESATYPPRPKTPQEQPAMIRTRPPKGH
jgi:hypothetical protein